MAQQNSFLLIQQCLKVVKPPAANPLFPNDFHNLPILAQLSMPLGLVGCKLKANCPLIEPGPIGGVPSEWVSF